MPRLGVVQRTLDLIVLEALSWGPAHGYAVTHRVRQVTDGRGPG